MLMKPEAVRSAVVIGLLATALGICSWIVLPAVCTLLWRTSLYCDYFLVPNSTTLALIDPGARDWEFEYHGLPWNGATVVGNAIGDRLRALYWLFKILRAVDSRSVQVHDANEIRSDEFLRKGFARIKLPQFSNLTEDMYPAYQSAIMEEIRKLLPESQQASDHSFLPIVQRSHFGVNNPPLYYPHADYQPTFSAMYQTKRLRGLQLFANKTDMRSTVLIGTWKPNGMNSTVCRGNLALLDSSTVARQDMIAVKKHFQVSTFQGVKKGSGAISLVRNVPSRQRWYAYSDLTSEDIVVFINYHPNILPVFHASFDPTYCKDRAPRSSVELRVNLKLQQPIYIDQRTGEF